MKGLDLPDLNVWLALADPDHEHHGRAQRYWETETGAEIAFCRITQLGLLRLLTNRKVMRNDPLTPKEAWVAYQTFAGLPEIVFLHGNATTEARFAIWTSLPAFKAHQWTDAWLASLAQATGARLVSFDGDFSIFPDLRFHRLIP